MTTLEAKQRRRSVRQAKRDQSAEEIQAARREREQERWTLVRRLRRITRIKRQEVCRLPGKREDGSVTVRMTEVTGQARIEAGRTRIVGFGGLFACGNVWTCPSCSVKIASARAAEVEKVLGHFVERGGTGALVTLTMRHHKGDRLTACWDAVSDAWAAVNTGSVWQADKQVGGGLEWVRSVEITHGWLNGWHVHVHAILMFRQRPAESTIWRVAEGMFDRWSRALVRAGFIAPDQDHHGLDVQFLDWSATEGKRFASVRDVARYVSKGLAAEATLGGQKQARNGNRTVHQLLRDTLIPQDLVLANGVVVSTLDDTARGLWGEYEAASRGRRQLTWSKGAQAVRKELAAETAELTDEDVADQELDGADVAVIPALSWHRIHRRAMELKHATEDGGREACWAWLDAAGVEWYRPTGLTHARLVE